MPHARAAHRIVPAVFLLLLLPSARRAHAAAAPPGPPLAIRRAAGPITIDGDLSDPGWQGADSVTTWYETRVGDNVEPAVRNVGFVTYDDRYFYAGFVFEDPNPSGIRAPLGDHDAITGSLDYAGVIVDSRLDGKTAQMFLADPRGLQYDAISSDVTGEDSSPDFFWDAMGKITPTGWTLEIRVPFSSLRYGHEPNPTWGLILYRNYPRDRHYQFFSTRLPRNSSCLVCNESPLTGLAGLPHSSHLVLAPYASASQTRAPDPDLGSPLHADPVEGNGGADVKWSPTANLAIDATVNPDFSQIESDVAQIVANERFALSFPEKRPFFLEGVDLFSMPLSAVYTRAITDPNAGVHVTGRSGATSYTALGVEDAGGGLVVLPGPQRSRYAPQDFVSDVGITRVRHDLGASFVSLLAMTREVHGGGSNRIVGPDFEWRPKSSESIKGQLLWAETQTPNRPDLTARWNGRQLADHASQLSWQHTTPHVDWYFQGQDIGPDFRDDNGFIPQVGYREAYLDAGYTIRPKQGFLSRQRIFATNWADVDVANRVINQHVTLGTGMDGRLNTFFRVELNDEGFRVGDRMLRRFRPRLYAEASPGRLLNFVSADAYVGEEVDFENARTAHGATLIGNLQLRPSAHLELRADVSRRWIDVNVAQGSGRLFTAQVERLRATWQFNARSFARAVVQYVDTKRDTALYVTAPDPRESFLDSSALLAYKLNWETVLYLGYGDDREYALATGRLERGGDQWFTKVSYAWQH